MNRSLKYILLVFGFSVTLLLNSSCRPVRTTQHNLPDPFPDKLAWTIHDISQFFKKVPVETGVPEEGGSVSSDGSGKAASNSSKETQIQIKQMDWIEAPLTEKHLKQLGALRIKTTSQGEEVKNSISQIGTVIDPHSRVSFINQYYRLDYNLLDVDLTDQKDLRVVKEDPKKLLAFLLGKVDKFYGFPDTDYYILPHLEGNYLVLYRLGRPGTIPYDQLPLARPVGDFLATPLVGYNIDYCVPENDEDDYGHLSDLIIPNCEGVAVESARYIQFQTAKKQLFQYEEKWDLFPKDFFNGEWFYLRTVVETGEKDAAKIGHQPFDPAYLVQFKPDKEQLVVKDTENYGLRPGDEETSLFIPVQWKEYEKDQDTGSFKSFGEREKSPEVQDMEKPYFSLDLNRLADIEKGRYSGQFIVRRVLVTDDSFHFDIHINRWNNTPLVVKYSFKRVLDNPDYPEKRWYEEDSARYHVFHVGRKYYPKATEVKADDLERFYRATRFDPDKGEIVWHFSTQTPKDDRIRDFARWAVEYENRVFQEAGKYSPRKIRVVLDESEDKELGDLRYNIINLVVSKSQVWTAFGFGPSIANPITGESVSATANVWVSSIENVFINMVRRYMRFHIWPLPWKLLPSSPGVSDFLHEKIQELCPEVWSFITESQGTAPPLPPLHSTGVLDYDKDREIQEQCGRKMARTSILSTIVHEMRHGHGFRHAFSASADRDNYYKDYEEIKALFGESVLMDDITESHPMPARFSSLMDYGSLLFPELTVPGKYDIAVTRYLYFDQLETVDEKGVVNGFVTLDSGDKSITQELSAGPVLFTDLKSKQNRQEINEDQLKRYFVCGGKNFDRADSGERDPNNPLCLRSDYGSTPREVVQNAIRNTKDNLMHGRRYDSEYLSSPSISAVGHIFPFIVRWTVLRYQLFNEKGIDIYNYYISVEKAKEYKRLIKRFVAESTLEEFKMLYEVIPIVADFFKEMLNLPPKHCIYQKADNSYEVVSMNVIHNKIKSKYPENSREILVHCQSDPVKGWADKEKMGDFIAEGGVFDLGGKYFVHPLQEDSLDEMPAASDMTAILTILSHIALTEPDVFQDTFTNVREIVLNGLDINPYVDKAALRRRLKLSEKETVPKFPNFLFPKHVTNADAFATPLFGQLINMKRYLISFLDKKSVSGVTKRHMILSYLFSVEGMDSLQQDLFRLTKDPLHAKDKMRDSYGQSHPFIYQAYLEYLDQYDTGQKQNEVSFMDFFQNLPSIVYLLNGRRLLIPYDRNNMFADIFTKYNGYKACVETADTCEKLEEKLAYIEVIENSLEIWMGNNQ